MKTLAKNMIGSTLLRLHRAPRLQSRVLAGISRVIPPPYLQPNMESTIGPFRGASSASCVDGRQIGENNVYPPYLTKTRHPTKTMKLDGSRTGCPVNFTALQLLLKHWAEAMAITDHARTRQIQLLNLPGGPLGYMDLLVLGEICTAMPAYLLRRCESPIDSEGIPLDVGSAYKLIAGLMKIIEKMIAEGDARLASEKVPDAAELYDYADDNDLLVARDGEACGGTRQMIMKLLNITIDGLDDTDRQSDFADSFVCQGSDFARYGIECAAIRMSYLLYRGELEREADALHQFRRQAEPDDQTWRMLEEVLALLPSPERIERIGASAFETSQTALNQTIRTITGRDLLTELANTRAAGRYLSTDAERLLNGAADSGQSPAGATLNSYACILSAASEFSMGQQRKINRLLGVGQTSLLEPAALATQVFGPAQPAAFDFRGMQLNHQPDERSEGRLVLC